MKNTKKFSAVLLSVCLLISLFTGCQSEQDRLYSEALGSRAQSDGESGIESSAVSDADTPAEGELSGTLVIGSIQEQHEIGLDMSFSGMALAFMEKYPNVTVEVEHAISMDELMEASKTLTYTELLNNHYQTLSVELMSGGGPDILIDYGYPLDKYAQSGMLVDLAPYMEADEEFIKEEYFYNGIEGMMHDGALYKMPLSFAVNLLSFDPEIAAQIEDVLPEGKEIHIDEVLNAYNTALERGLIPEDYTFSFWNETGQRLFLEEMLATRISILDREVNLTDEGFINYLKAMKNIPTGEEWTSSAVMGTLGLFQYEGGAFLDYQALTVDWITHIEYADYFSEDTEEGKRARAESVLFPRNFFDTPSMYIAKDDEGRTLRPTAMMAATASCDNPELAWEFIKFCINGEKKEVNEQFHGADGELISEEVVPITAHLMDGFAVHKNNAKGYIEMMIGEEAQYDEWEEYLSQAETGYGVGYVEDMALIQIIEEILKEYYETGLMTAEECAEKIQDRVYIYVNE